MSCLRCYIMRYVWRRFVCASTGSKEKKHTCCIMFAYCIHLLSVSFLIFSFKPSLALHFFCKLYRMFSVSLSAVLFSFLFIVFSCPYMNLTLFNFSFLCLAMLASQACPVSDQPSALYWIYFRLIKKNLLHLCPPDLPLFLSPPWHLRWYLFVYFESWTSCIDIITSEPAWVNNVMA